MNIQEGLVEQVYVNDAKEGNYGTFYPQVLKVEGKLFTKNAKTKDPIATVGDRVKFLYETKTSSQGKEFHNISGSKGGFEILSTGNASEESTTTQVNKPTVTTASTQSTTGSITATTRSIARQSSLKVAVQLLLSPSCSQPFDKESLKTLTLELEEFVLEPYTKGTDG